MLSRSKVLLYIKSKLGYPHVTIELDDDQMWDYIKNFTLYEFSKYLPDVHEMTLNTKDSSCKTDDEFVYILNEPDGCQIMNVQDVILPQTNLYILGYPYQGPLISYDSLPDAVLGAEEAETIEQFSNNGISWRFYSPNKIRINMAMLPNKVVIRYSRVQPESLYYINPEYEAEFLNLCLADIMMICGNIRTKYQSLSTPFGEIQLNGDLAQAGDTLKQNVTARLECIPPNTLVVVG